MRSGRDAAHQQLVPKPAGGGAASLPLLPLFDAVLLPGGFARVTIPSSWRASAALVELLLQQQGDADMLVAAVPFLTGKPSSSGGAAGSSVGSDDEGLADEPLDLDRLHHTGTAARVLQLARRTQSSGWSVLLEGRCRVRVRGVHLSSRPRELYEASVEQLDYLPPSPGKGIGASSSSGAGGSKEEEELAQELLKGTRRLFVLIQGETEGRAAATRVARALSQQGPARMADVLGSLVGRTLRDRLALLSTLSVTARQQMVLSLLGQMLEVAEKAAAGRGARRSGGSSQRGARSSGGGGGLRLPDFGGAGSGEEDEEEEGKQELLALMQKLKDADPPAEVLRAAQREFKRLQRGSEHHPGYAMSLSYLETLADLPWSRLSQLVQQQLPPDAAGSSPEPGPGSGSTALSLLAPGGGGAPLPLGLVRQRLDEAHYGLDKIKERIVQFVAVQRLRGWDARAPILCFIGPPGVGKTSLARSIADVLGRPFQRISLGGVRDEAEIRGHRRTYIGAMPGRVIQAMRKAGVRDPLLLLDEVDKMGRDARGDPAAALLEVLDPEQNGAFLDTYLGLPFDLSSALFVATANRASDIPPPLLDRLEVVQLGGYTLEEKVHIAERHLIPRLLAEHGLRHEQLVFPTGAVRSIIEGYTSEAGVRSLSRCLAAICRHVAVQVVRQREEEGSSAPLLSGLHGAAGSSSSGSSEQPDLPPGLEEAAARAAAAAGVVANNTATPPLAALRSMAVTQAVHSRGGGMLVQPPYAGQDSSSMRLWAQLLPLAGSPAAAAAAATATGGYPWRQLQPPVRREGKAAAAAAEAAASSAQCTCPSRKQPRWFSWLRWARHDGTAEQAQQEAGCGAGGEAGHACSCAGRCGDPDCCCHSIASRGQPADAAGHEAWGPPGEAGMAADSSSWEASWRQSALARELPLLCGPGSMQVLRPPPAEAMEAAGGVRMRTAPRLAVGAAAAAATAVAARAQQGASGLPLALPLDGLTEAGGMREQGWPPLGRQQQQLIVVDEALIEAVLGPRRFEGHNNAERVASPGTAAGLVWTSVGGKVQYIECICVGAGRGGAPGQLTLTGQLGDVLEESARIALSWVRAHAAALGLPGDASCPSRRWDVHIHLPAGAVPKDGPSAGITLAVALVSLFTGKCVRADTAMTGELTLRGLVLPVGGIKEKLLAAQACARLLALECVHSLPPNLTAQQAAGMARVLVPARNMPDVQADVPAEVRQGLEVVACSRLEDVLAAAFEPPISLAPQPLLARL